MKRIIFVNILLAILILTPIGVANSAEKEIQFPSWMWGEVGTGDWFKDGVAQFETQFTDIKVVDTLIPAGQYEEKLLIDMAGGGAPDLAPVFTNMMPKLIRLGLLEPLDDYLANVEWANNLLPVKSVAQYEGKIYGIPLTASPNGLIYNKKLLEKAGVGVPTTPEEMYLAAKKIKEVTGEFGYGFATRTADVLEAYIPLMQWAIGFGGDFSKDGVPTANDPKTIEGLTFLKRFYDEDLTPKGLDGPMLRKMFVEEKIAMLIDGPWAMTYVQGEVPELYPYIGFAAPPTPTHAAITGGAFYTIPVNAKNKKEAFALISIYNQTEMQRRWLEELLQIPGQAVEASSEFLQKHPWINDMVDVAAKYPAGFGYAAPGFEEQAGEVQRMVVDGIARVWGGQTTVEEAMNDVQKRMMDWTSTLKR
ncbi:ABC transporter substrate-binding protein [Atribacter laminatus]|uniref:Cyclodextrin-binding protein n=1 Tax=Atribacter laminatus TaxID=2847778 RepID=A0A7T1AKL2_ATRLM|nr:sugar ABC transporter substrate-binding protein [Atribacter laminatus]QPM67647.1 Cyclodextrin-binding protein [Atribacter laminatus]